MSPLTPDTTAVQILNKPRQLINSRMHQYYPYDYSSGDDSDQHGTDTTK
jgi:hypothetical protein